jgi:thiol-disulfide isomerase/thioredoxin
MMSMNASVSILSRAAATLFIGAISAALLAAGAGCQTTMPRRSNYSVLPPPPPEPKIGDLAPPIFFEDALQVTSSSDLAWSSLRGNVVVLEFWATWCGPCLAATPHLNELADRFRGRPVVFISVTDEPREKVEPFLQGWTFKSRIGLDTDRSSFLDYRVGGIPRTVLIDRSGVIRDVTLPKMLRADAIEALLNDQG